MFIHVIGYDFNAKNAIVNELQHFMDEIKG
jgi:hypothetical protein